MTTVDMTFEYVAQFEKKIKALDDDATFFDPARYPWAREVEQHWPEIRAELDNILGALDILPGFEEIQVEQIGLSADKRWKIFPLVIYNQDLQRNRARCPITARALRHIPGLHVAMFSIFQGGKELPPHRGPYGGVLRYHLGLKVPHPELCGISVGGDEGRWHEGKSLIFDDSHDHHAWNRSDEDRVVLFVDFTRPLPEDLREDNDTIIKVISETDFIGNIAINWAAWEQKYGEQLDALLAQQPATV